MEVHFTAQLQYGITQCYLPPPTQVTPARLADTQFTYP